MMLIATFAALFAYGWWRAARAGGGTPDRVRYGFIHGLAGALAVFAVATLGDWWGWFD